MSWKQHLVLAVLAVLALAVTAYAQPTVTSVSVSPVPQDVVISPNVNSFSLYVYANVSNYSTSYTYTINVTWLGTNYTISSVSASQVGGTTTYELSGSTTLPTPSKPGTYTGTVYVIVSNSSGVVNYTEASFTVYAYPLDIVNYTWFTVPGVGYQCITPNSTFEFELLVYIKPVPANGYLWSNATFLGTNGSNTIQTTPNVTGVEWIYDFTAPSSTGTYSGTAFFGNYTTTYEVPWTVTVVSNCSTTTSTPSPSPMPVYGIWINSITVSPNPVYVVVGQSNFTVSLTINYVANMTGLINVGVNFMNMTFTGALNVSNGYWSFGDPTVTVPLTLTAPTSTGTYTATITATSPNSTASTTLTVIVVNQSQVPSTAVLIKNITITPNPITGAPNQTVTANATVYFYSVPQTTKVTVVVSLGNYSDTVTLTVPANTTEITTPVTIRLPQSTGNYTGFATAIGQYNSVSTRFTALVVTSLSVLLSTQYLPLELFVLLLIIVLVALALRKRQVEIRI